jgi:CDP-diacylglycerol--serine O-phosphatidyltransferase
MIVKVARRRRTPGEAVVGGRVVYGAPEPIARRPRRSAMVESITPVSPALPPTPRRAETTSLTIPLLPGERTPERRLKFAIANGCTIGSLLLGMGAIFLAIHGDLRVAALAILGCVVLDGCDGGLARRFGVASPFGAQMDSLADLSSFGVATGVVIYQWLLLQGASSFAAGPAAGVVAVCAAIRLARFNVSPKNGRFFSGVPTTMAAAVLVLNILLGPQLPVQAQLAVVVVYALAMVSSFPYAKLARVLRLPLWLWVFPAILAMVSLPAAFLAIVFGYLISGPVLALWRRRRPIIAA